MAPTTPAKTPSKIKPKSSNGKRQKKGDDNGKANRGAETKTSPTRMGSRSNRKKTKETTPSVKFDLKKKYVVKGNYSSKLVIPPNAILIQQGTNIFQPKGKRKPLSRPIPTRTTEFIPVPDEPFKVWVEENLHKKIPKGQQKTLKSVLKNNLLYEVQICDVGMNEIGASLLASYLAYNESVCSINLARNNLATGATEIFEAVAGHRSIKDLNMDCNGIKNSQCKGIEKMLTGNDVLQSLSISGNYITAKGCKAIANALKQNITLLSLNISSQINHGDHGIGEEGAKHFAECMLSGLALQRLDLSSNHLGYKGAEHLGNAFKSNPSSYWGKLEVLNLASNNFGRRGARALAPGLAVNETLQQIDLSWNSLGEMKTTEKDPKGIIAICKAMKRNRTLKVLNLSGNTLSNRGADLVSEMLNYNSTLSRIALRCNGIESLSVQSLLQQFKSCRNLVHVDLAGNTVPFGKQANTVDKDAWVHPELLRLRKPYGVELVPPPPKGFVLSATVPNNMMITYGDIPKVIQPQTIDVGKIRVRYHV
eukprot:g1927.t1